MKEVKEFSKSYVLVSTLYVVLGGVLLAWPDISMKMIGYVLGFSLLIIGFTYGIVYFTRDNLAGVLQLDLVIGIVAAAFGIFILLNQDFLPTVFPIAMGIILLLGSVLKIQNAVSMKRLQFRRWYICLIFALILAALGGVLLVNPFTSDRWLALYIGACLILDGVVNLVAMSLIVARMKKLEKEQKNAPTPVKDFTGETVEPSEVIIDQVIEDHGEEQEMKKKTGLIKWGRK